MKRVTIEVSSLSNTGIGDKLQIGFPGCRSELLGTVVKVEDVTGKPVCPTVVHLGGGVTHIVRDDVVDIYMNGQLIWQQSHPIPSPPAIDQLLPCPFCGGKARQRECFAGCIASSGECEAAGYLFRLDTWNRRRV